jgi:hypothetical protein
VIVGRMKAPAEQRLLHMTKLRKYSLPSSPVETHEVLVPPGPELKRIRP